MYKYLSRDDDSWQRLCISLKWFNRQHSLHSLSDQQRMRRWPSPNPANNIQMTFEQQLTSRQIHFESHSRKNDSALYWHVKWLLLIQFLNPVQKEIMSHPCKTFSNSVFGRVCQWRWPSFRSRLTVCYERLYKGSSTGKSFESSRLEKKILLHWSLLFLAYPSMWVFYILCVRFVWRDQDSYFLLLPKKVYTHQRVFIEVL